MKHLVICFVVLCFHLLFSFSSVWAVVQAERISDREIIH